MLKPGCTKSAGEPILDAHFHPGIRYSLVPGEGGSGNSLVILRGRQLFSANVLDQEKTPSFQIRVRATDRTGAFTDRVFTMIVRDINERPAINVPPLFHSTGEIPVKLVFPNNMLNFDNALPARRVTVMLRVTKGAIHAISHNGVTVGGTQHARTFHGTAAALNTYFSAESGLVNYAPPHGFTGSRLLKVLVRESFNGATRVSLANSRVIIVPLCGN